MLHRGSAEEKRRRQLPSFLVAKYGLTALFYFTIAWRRTRQSAEEHVCMSWEPSRLVSSRRGGTALATHIQCPRFDDTVVSSGLVAVAVAVAVAMGNLTCSMTAK